MKKDDKVAVESTNDEKRIETVDMRAGDIKTGFGNPRTISKKKREELQRSLEAFGNFGTFVIDEDDNIIAGNMRLSVICDMDPDTIVPCRKLIGYSEAEKRAINIKDNTHSGEWELDMLADWTADLSIDLGLGEEVRKKDYENRKIDEMELVAFEKYNYVVIATRTDLDFDILTDKLGIKGMKVPIKTSKGKKVRTIKARAVWYEEVEDRLFGGKSDE